MPFFIIISFLISVSLIPIVIYICQKQSWYDSENERKVHSGKTPRLGSVGFVPAFAISAFLFFTFDTNINVTDIIPLIFSFLIFPIF